MTHLFHPSTLLVLAGLVLGVSTTAHAGPVIGNQAFADIGAPTLIGSTDINFATGFNFGSLVTTLSRDGGFASGASGLAISATAFVPITPSSFTLGSSVFGFFTATSDTLVASTATTQSYVISGFFTPGTEFGGGAAQPATLSVSFTQNGGPNSAISDSATLTTTAVVIPEPASAALLGLGLAAFGGVSACRRRRPA